MAEKLPKAPATLGEHGRRKWEELVLDLVSTRPGTLTTLEVYCKAYERWVAAQEWLGDHGDVVEFVSDKGVVTGEHPAAKLDVAARAEKAMAEALRALPLRIAS